MTKQTIEEAILEVLTESDHVVTVGQLSGLVNAHLADPEDRTSVSQVRTVATRMARDQKIATDVQDGTIRYKRLASVPIDTGAHPPRDYPVYTSRRSSPGALKWRIYRQDPGANCYQVLGQGLTKDEVGVCVRALNELALIKHRRGKTEDAIRQFAHDNGAPPEAGEAVIATQRAELANAQQLALGIQATKARVVLDQGEHWYAYFAEETRSWWLVTAAALIELGAMLQGGGNLTAWEEQDTTARELDRSEARRLKLLGMEK